jgi:Helix-turn-helix domain
MITQPATLKPDEAHTILGKDKISRRAFYNALNRNQIPNVRLGRRILVPRVAFFRWLDKTSADSTRPTTTPEVRSGF